jgi:SAM-dependent methyltransferase
MNCRVCKAGVPLWADRGDVALFRCARCHSMSGEPREQLAAGDRYEGYYHRASPPVPEARYQEWLTRAEAMVGRGHLLEVGAGSGGFVRVALARGWEVDATEVSESGLRALAETGARIFGGELPAAQYGDAQFDLVVSLEVLEHLPTPREHLREMWRITRAGGALLLTTPNFGGLSRRCLGIRWRVIDPEHLCYFTPSTLARIVRQVGYGSVHVTSRSLDVLSWRRGKGPAGARAFDPDTSAMVRERIESHRALRVGRLVVNRILQLTDLGDSLLVWARR